MTTTETVHASAVLVGEHGVLIRGASGSGKSSLVLGLIDRDPLSTRLIADDRVHLDADRGKLVAAVPNTIAGKLEVRGLGIVEVAHASPAAIDLVVDLLPPDKCPRLPEADDTEVEIRGVIVPRLMLPIGLVDGPARVRFAAQRLRDATPA